MVADRYNRVSRFASRKWSWWLWAGTGFVNLAYLGFHSNGFDRFQIAFYAIRSMHLAESRLLQSPGDRGHIWWNAAIHFLTHGHFMDAVIFAGRGHIWWLRPSSLTTVILFERCLFSVTVFILAHHGHFWWPRRFFGDCGRIRCPQPFWLSSIVFGDRGYLSWPRLFLATPSYFGDRIHFFFWPLSFLCPLLLFFDRSNFGSPWFFVVIAVIFGDHGNFCVRGYFGLNALNFPGHFSNHGHFLVISFIFLTKFSDFYWKRKEEKDMFSPC